MKSFNVVSKEDNRFKLGEILANFKLDGCDKEFVLYVISDFDKKINFSNVAYIRKNNEGYDCLEEISDAGIRRRAAAAAKKLYEDMTSFKNGPEATGNRIGKRGKK